MKRIVATILCMIILICGTALAESNAWAFCKTYVNIRMSPSKKSVAVGFLDCGDGFETDWKLRNGWLHCVSPVDGWVHAGYVVDNKPEKVDCLYYVVSNWRVALRKTVGGNRRAWVHNGDELKVLWKSDEWSLTTRGYIKTEYIEEAAE